MCVFYQAVVDVLPCVCIFNLNKRSNDGINEWNEIEIKKNNIIPSEIIANSNISNIKPSTRPTGMTRKLHDIGRKFSQTWQDTVAAGRDFKAFYDHNFFLCYFKTNPFNMNPSTNDY